MRLKNPAIVIITLFLTTASLFAEYSGGSGEPNNPWQISCPNDLLYLAAHPADYNSCFILTADIDLAGYSFTNAVIAPCPSSSCTLFEGIFDGNGFVIRNLTIDTHGGNGVLLGLFGLAGSGSQIRNLGVEKASVTGGSHSIVLGGCLCGSNAGLISNCYAIGSVTGGDSTEYQGVLVGRNSSLGTISNCYSRGSVNGYRYVGGICGGSSGTITNSFSTSTVKGKGRSWDSSWDLGGLVGHNSGTVSDCYAAGLVICTEGTRNLGGLVGNNWRGTISNCYATGPVMGYYSGYGLGCLGGLVGDNSGAISNCYSTGKVEDIYYSPYAGGLVGRNGSIINNCFWDTQTSGFGRGYGDNVGTITNLLRKTTAEMQTQSTFTDYGWDFVGETENGTEDLWRMSLQNGYPALNWQVGNIYSGGTGTEDNPWQIAEPSDLLDLAERIEDYGAHFILTADIDLAGYTFNNAVIAPTYEGRQYSSCTFRGKFNGNGFVIRNLSILINSDYSSYIGLFGVTDSGCEITNLGIEEVSITSSGDYRYLYYYGGLAGENYYGKIDKCYVKGRLAYKNFGAVGGLVGYNYSGEINNCYARCAIEGDAYLCGLVGFGVSGNISNCYAASTFSTRWGWGTVYGLTYNYYGAVISNCFWDIETSDCNTSAGGIGKTTAEMQTQSTFTDYGWDFVGETANGTEDIWRVPFKTGYPVLNWQILNFVDYAAFANAWLSTPPDANWNPLCDLKPDNIIDNLDLQILVEHWLNGL